MKGLKVLVPRPRVQGERIGELILSRGGSAIVFPVIEIVEPDDYSSLDECLYHLSDVDLIVLVSASAVQGFARRQQALGITLPDAVKVAAVGPKTAIQCKTLGIPVNFSHSQRIGSEGLLDCINKFNLKDKNVVICRGQSGRELLKIELERLGANVKYVVCYRRKTSTQSIQPVLERWKQGEINAVVISSVSVLEALIELLGENNVGLLKETTIVTISHRIADQCTKASITDILIADDVSDNALLELLAQITRQRALE